MRFLSTPPDIDDSRVSILDHLEELRGRLLKSLGCIAILFPLCWYLCPTVLQWFLEVICVDLPKVQTLQIMELFFTEMKVSFFMAIVLAYPFLAFQVWQFVAPGLYRHERQYVARFVVASSALFVVGAEFALLFVFPRVVQFGASLATGKIEMTPQLSSVINLASMLMLGFGVMFQSPIVVYLLAVTGLVSVATMRKTRPLIVIVIFVMAAILTPTPDVVTQCALALPSVLLFEISLIFTDVAIRRKQRRKQAEEERQAEEDRQADAEREQELLAAGIPPAPAAPAAPAPSQLPAAEPVPVVDVTAPVTPPAGPEAEGVAPAPTGPRPGEVPNYDTPEEPSGNASWERWYGNVSADAPAEPPAATPTAVDAPAPAPAASVAATAGDDEGPIGSGQV